MAWVQTLALLLRETLGRLVNLSVTQFLHLENEMITELLEGLNSLTCLWHVISIREVLAVVVIIIMLLYYPHPLSPIWPPSTNLALQAICLLTPESALGLKCPIFQSSETQFKVIFNSTCHPNPTAGHGHSLWPLPEQQ